MSFETKALLNALRDKNFGAFREGGLELLKKHIEAKKVEMFSEALKELNLEEACKKEESDECDVCGCKDGSCDCKDEKNVLVEKGKKSLKEGDEAKEGDEKSDDDKSDEDDDDDVDSDDDDDDESDKKPEDKKSDEDDAKDDGKKEIKEGFQPSEFSKPRATKSMKVAVWYKKNFPTDELGDEINPSLTFMKCFSEMTDGKEIYKVLGVGDSIVRERVFSGIADAFKVDYDTVYDVWVHG